EPGPAAQDAVAAFGGALRILFGSGLVVGAAIPVAGPLPDIADHIAQAEVVLLLGADVLRAVVQAKNGKLGVGTSVAPRVLVALGNASTGAFPLGFRGKTLSLPGAERRAVIPAHVDYGTLFHSVGDFTVAPLVGGLMVSGL